MILLKSHAETPSDTILLSTFHRNMWRAALDGSFMKIAVVDFQGVDTAAVTFLVKPMARQPRPTTLDTGRLRDEVAAQLAGLPVMQSQEFAVKFGGELFSLEAELVVKRDETDPTGEPCKLAPSSYIMFRSGTKEIRVAGEFGIAETSAMATALLNLMHESTNQADGSVGLASAESLGIGGINKQFKDIFRRAFMMRTLSAEQLAKLGYTHVKGLLLYGPPGTGKTLTARKIGELLNARPPKMVSGPELLDKYVGGSEQKVRDLFSDAFKEWKEKGDASELHIIILDELDAVCKQRGSKADNTGTMDSLVNQLLAMMDGPDALGNVLVVGMTNRKELIDKALLRPGRFEVQIEVGLPDRQGREQILRIHTKKLAETGSLASDVDIPRLAERTPNFSGAELAGLVRSAGTFAVERMNIAKYQSKADGMKRPDRGQAEVLVTADDFEHAMGEVRAAYGQADKDVLDAAAPLGIMAATGYNEIIERAVFFGNTILTENINSGAMLLAAPVPGIGCTALCSVMASELGCEFVRVISSEQLVMETSTEYGRADFICQAFEAAYRVPRALIILDGIESLIQYTPIGFRFSSTLLQTLAALIRRQPPPSCRLIVLGTTRCLAAMREAGLVSVFNRVFDIPSLTPEQAVDAMYEYVEWEGNCNAEKKKPAVPEVRYRLDAKPANIKEHQGYKILEEWKNNGGHIAIRDVLRTLVEAKKATREAALKVSPNVDQPLIITNEVVAEMLKTGLS